MLINPCLKFPWKSWLVRCWLPSFQFHACCLDFCVFQGVIRDLSKAFGMLSLDNAVVLFSPECGVSSFVSPTSVSLCSTVSTCVLVWYTGRHVQVQLTICFTSNLQGFYESECTRTTEIHGYALLPPTTPSSALNAAAYTERMHCQWCEQRQKHSDSLSVSARIIATRKTTSHHHRPDMTSPCSVNSMPQRWENTLQY